jgi:hypothetical protein
MARTDSLPRAAASAVAPAGGMDAAQVVHGADRQPRGKTAGQHRIRHIQQAGNADQARHQVAAEQGPRLRQGPCGTAKSMAAVEPIDSTMMGDAAARARHGWSIDRENADETAERGNQPLTVADRAQFDAQHLQPSRCRHGFLLFHLPLLELAGLVSSSCRIRADTKVGPSHEAMTHIKGGGPRRRSQKPIESFHLVSARSG